MSLPVLAIRDMIWINMELKFFILILFATNFLSFSALEILDFPHPEEFSFSYGQEVAYLKRSISLYIFYYHFIIINFQVRFISKS